MPLSAVSTEIDDPVNAAVLAVSEDLIEGFNEHPFQVIADRANLPLGSVLSRIRRMLEAGTIRRVRQTLMATNLAKGSLVAWQICPDRLDAAFNYMFENDPFSGHVVIRSAESTSPGASYRLWTTLKVPQSFSLQKHAEFLLRKTGADKFLLMPANRLFALGVGHVRRLGMEPGAKSDELADVLDTQIVELSDLDWQVLIALKRELTPDEIADDLWVRRAAEAEVPYATFIETAKSLSARGVIGRFSTFLEHVKPSQGNVRATRYNALFHWAIPKGREIETGRQVGRFAIMTHAYWREGGQEFKNVNIMGVAHGLDKDMLLAHKAAIDAHLESVGIEVSYTNVFWGGRSEIKPSEISPIAYREFCLANNLDPEDMR
jgi:DNA-binding Lrp family transcriptional regulator